MRIYIYVVYVAYYIAYTPQRTVRAAAPVGPGAARRGSGEGGARTSKATAASAVGLGEEGGG